MKSSIFNYPYEKVFRRTKGGLSRLGMKIVKFDAIEGSIRAVSGFSFRKPVFTIDILVKEMANHDTRVTITGLIIKKLFYMKEINTEASEAEILGNLSIIY
ncbi:MAG: hypothetical protein ABI763_08395 [Bacteroidota bacterium]